MPVRYTVQAQIEGLQATLRRLRSLQQASNQAMQQAVNEVRPFALAELQTIPKRRPVGRDEYVSDAQRGYVYGVVLQKDAQGNIIPYERTGDTAAGWEVLFTSTPGGGGVAIANPTRAARFVYGSLARDRQQALRFQQPFHARTGWQAATDTVQFWLEAILEQYLATLQARLMQGDTAVISQRAITPRLARRR